MPESEATLRIATRFNGPPTSGNGGYVCGELARSLPGPAARVRLRRPPPLETTLRIVTTEVGASLYDEDTLLAEAWPATLTLEAPEPPSFEAAVRASRDYRGFADHPFPDCFVCGPQRAEGDGLRLFPGALAGRPEPGLVATPWTPDASLAPDGGAIDPVFVWSALDCPGCFSFPQPDDAFLLLGELTVRIDASVEPGDRCVVLGWSLGRDGRKHTTATALYDGSGRCCGVGQAIWIEVSRS